MGLDMYVHRDISLKNEQKDSIKEMLGIALGEYPTYKDDVIYWRKANQVFGWFETEIGDTIENSMEYDISIEQLIKLQDVCKQVLENRELAPELLPAKQGFFFGSYEYNDWYFNDLEDTIKQIDKCLEEHKVLEEKDYFVYYNFYANW